MSTLVAGYTSWLDDDLAQDLDGGRIAVLGEGTDSRQIKHLEIPEGDGPAQVMRAGFDRIIYVSHALDFGRAPRDEYFELDALLRASFRSDGVHVVYVGSDVACLDSQDGAAINARALERLCELYRDRGLNVLILRTARILDCSESGFWWETFQNTAVGKDQKLPVSADQPADFVDAGDTARLMSLIFESWPDAPVLRLRPALDSKFSDVIASLPKKEDEGSIAFADVSPRPIPDAAEDEADAEEAYGFKPSTDVVKELAACHDAAAASLPRHSRGHQTPSALRPGGPVLIALELAVGFALVQWLTAALSGNVQFRMIDLRLLYIVLFSATYGIRIGGISAALMTLSLVWAYVGGGYTPVMLFYDAQNWVPFVCYFVVASWLGYLHERHEEDAAAADRETARLNDELSFTSKLYDEAAASRDAYAHDLLASRDGFGRIFDVVQKLSLEEPARIFTASIGVLEDVLDTKKVAIYIINDRAEGFARLVVSSRALEGRLPKSVRLDDFGDAIATLEAGDVWFDPSLTEGRPSYIAGVKSDGDLRVLITIFDASFAQASAYYANLIRILAGLMENFLIRAWHAEEGRVGARYVSGTGLLTADALEAEAEPLRESKARHEGDYRIVRIEAGDEDLADVERRLSHQLRSTDLAGLGRDGAIYVVLRQADDKSLPAIIKRFRSAGIDAAATDDEDAL